MIKRILLSAVAILLVAPAGLLGQSNIKFELVAEGGVFLPVRDLAQESITVGANTFNFNAKQQPGPAGAARVILWFGAERKFGFEATGQYSWSDVEIRETAEPTVTESAAVWNATGRFAANFPIPDSKTSIFVNIGLGVVGRTGDAFEGDGGLTDIAGVVGTGGRIRVAEKVAIRLDIDGVFYQFKPTEGTPEPGAPEANSKFQADLSFLAGISFALGG